MPTGTESWRFSTPGTSKPRSLSSCGFKNGSGCAPALLFLIVVSISTYFAPGFRR